MSNYQILKLSSGEEIVCKVTNDHPRTYDIESPLKINVIPRVTKFGMEESVSLQRWIHFAEDNNFSIEKNKIVIMTNASVGLIKFYEYCVDKMDREWDDLEDASTEELEAIEEEELFDEYETPSKIYH